MNRIAEQYPDYGRPPLSQEELFSIADSEPLAEVPRHLSWAEKEICGLSRQCMQFNMEHHQECTGLTRAACTCIHHVENR